MAEKTYTLLGPDRKPYTSTTPGTLGGHRGNHAYGRLDCRTALRAIARGGYVSKRVFFADETAALAAGYRPCGACLNAKYRAWKAGIDPRTVEGAQVRPGMAEVERPPADEPVL